MSQPPSIQVQDRTATISMQLQHGTMPQPYAMVHVFQTYMSLISKAPWHGLSSCYRRGRRRSEREQVASKIG